MISSVDGLSKNNRNPLPLRPADKFTIHVHIASWLFSRAPGFYLGQRDKMPLRSLGNISLLKMVRDGAKWCILALWLKNILPCKKRFAPSQHRQARARLAKTKTHQRQPRSSN